MATVNDVAAYILAKKGSMTAMKLEKLVYYSQAWHLVWEEKPLFPDRIEAWANGPVCPVLYAQHRGEFRVDRWTGNPDALEDDELESIDVVLTGYGEVSAHELSEMTHRESPWRDARGGLGPGERSNAEITPAAMFAYYDGLTTANAQIGSEE
jgi:uncharacterized phage-associated protein